MSLKLRFYCIPVEPSEWVKTSKRVLWKHLISIVITKNSRAKAIRCEIETLFRLKDPIDSSNMNPWEWSKIMRCDQYSNQFDGLWFCMVLIPCLATSALSFYVRELFKPVILQVRCYLLVIYTYRCKKT
jgi:hypothetical protein